MGAQSDPKPLGVVSFGFVLGLPFVPKLAPHLWFLVVSKPSNAVLSSKKSGIFTFAEFRFKLMETVLPHISSEGGPFLFGDLEDVRFWKGANSDAHSKLLLSMEPFWRCGLRRTWHDRFYLRSHQGG